jgi:histidine phosphotransferase ChpT
MQGGLEAGLLAELLCARLCHDLAGSVGAVSAGAELLAEEGADSPLASEALALMAGSAASLAARLRYLRLALGPGNQSAVHQVREVAEVFFSKGHPQGAWRLDWPDDQTVNSADRAKLVLNLICLAQECLPKGGSIAVRPGASSIVTAQGAVTILGESVQGLNGTASFEWGPRTAQGAYAALLARRLGARISVHQDEGAVVFKLNEGAGGE